ncbi:hypothetical protein [Luteibacter sp. CQ10]|uniref:hypothetical protein n=1 Tax=Luteibacter sp. CQ10 TaxID=2805821 RepID=UPI0034A5C7A2
MIMRTVCVALACLWGAGAVHAHDALLDAALARTAVAPADVPGTIRVTSTVFGGDTPETTSESIDPKKEPKKALPSYAELKDVIGADAHVAGQSGGRTTYAFTTRHVPRGFSQAGSVSVSMDGKDDEETFDGRAEVSNDAGGKPYVSHVDLRLQAPSGNWLAKVKKLDLSYAFEPDTTRPDAMLATAMDVEVDVRAMLFVHAHARANARLVRTPAAPSP